MPLCDTGVLLAAGNAKDQPEVVLLNSFGGDGFHIAQLRTTTSRA